MQLEGRVAFITGGGSGIGKAAALLLAQEGARIGIVDMVESRAHQTAEEIRAAGGEAIGLHADVSQPDQVQNAIAAIGKEWDRLDIVFANAGINGVWASIEELTPEEWDTTLNVNLKGTFLAVKYALPYLKRQGGSVVITSSVNGTRMFSNSGATAYACAKGGQAIFAKMTALELAKYRIRVNAICPGSVNTNLGENTFPRNLDQVRHPAEFPSGTIPLTGGQAATAEQVAQLVLFLVSDASSHISGSEIWIDGTQSLLLG